MQIEIDIIFEFNMVYGEAAEQSGEQTDATVAFELSNVALIERYFC